MQAKTKPGTKKLSEVAKFLARPSGIVATEWPSVEETCRTKLGVQFDEWQKGCGRLILAKRANGKLAATIGGSCMSFPRQVGKTYLLAGTIFALCINRPGLLVIWTAHHLKTSGETFLAMQAFAQRKRVEPYIDQVYTGSGDEEVRFHNGSRILFGARERGFGRGIPGVDVLIFDEAQILSDKALENMLATMNTSQFGLHLYIGTPPKPEDNSEAFNRMRTEALEAIKTNDGLTEDLVWIECGAAEGADPNSRAVYAVANPSFPHRTPIESILRLRKKLTKDGFMREGLGVWDPAALKVFSEDAWVALKDPSVPPPHRVALVIAVSQDRKWASIAAAGQVDDGRTLVMCFSMSGLGGVAEKVVELQAARDIAVVKLAGAQSKALKPDLTTAGVEFEQIPATDLGGACTAFQEAVKKGPNVPGALVHLGQGELDTAVKNAQTRFSGESEQWDRRDPKVDDSPLVACSAAYYEWTLLEDPMPAFY
ncbi:terminase large subunit [Mycobacterium phage MooMoo]|uniref:Terminase large subunit n=1 Tax=Mycobacterium phage MooMoo TaxID=2108127 RepID=A0A2P1JR29_9CAUD|nr:terminase large subunit [Mycobacterium phage MooMoo]AVO21608.1 terminase large subunit [Mycobacterium phage MooMoo]